jgi:hypothetical protein
MRIVERALQPDVSDHVDLARLAAAVSRTGC